MWTSVTRRLGTRLIAPAAVACALCVPAWAADTNQATTEGGQPAVWTQKEVTFVYMGFTTKYSCDGLRDKVRGVLLDLGAKKKDLKVRETGCSASFGGPDPFPGVRVTMNVLEPANSSSATDDRQPPVAAHWKPVDLKLRDSFANDSGECELVEQIRSKIVPLFATRNVDLKTYCVPHQLSASQPVLKMEVLTLDKADDKSAAP
jgi:hypothetical protein